LRPSIQSHLPPLPSRRRTRPRRRHHLVRLDSLEEPHPHRRSLTSEQKCVTAKAHINTASVCAPTLTARYLTFRLTEKIAIEKGITKHVDTRSRNRSRGQHQACNWKIRRHDSRHGSRRHHTYRWRRSSPPRPRQTHRLSLSNG